MTARLNFIATSHDVVKAMLDLQEHVSNSGLEPNLLHLVYMLASRINGCAYCIDMHGQDLRAMGESDLRIDLVHEWYEAPCYSDRERAAFAWTESVTRVSQTHVPDDVFALARKHFTEDELVKLTLAIVAINGWNRFAISFRTEPGHYKPAKAAAQNKKPAA